MLFLLACGSAAPEPELAPALELVEVEDNRSSMVDEAPRYDQAHLAQRSDGVRVSGEILCDQPGPWTVRVYPKHFDPSPPVQGQLPGYGHLSEVRVEETGAFELLTTTGTSRRVLAFREEGGELRLAFTDPHASFLDLRGHISGLVLDCSIEPVEGHTDQLGEQVAKAAPQHEEQDLDWLHEAGGEEMADAQRQAAYERKMSGLEARYGRERMADLAPLIEELDPETARGQKMLEDHLPIGMDD